MMKFKKLPSKLYMIFEKYNLQRKIAKLDPLALAEKVTAKKLTYLNRSKLFLLLESIKKVNDENVEGLFLEAGCALGGSLVIISSYAKNRKVLAYDTFAMIPPPTAEDPPEVHERYKIIASGKSKGLGDDIYYGYRNDLLSFVSSNIAELSGDQALKQTKLFKGLLQDTMKLDNPIAFAHIDVDWYEPVLHSITQIWPLLSAGGIVIFDDYSDWGGCKKAVNEYFADKNDYQFVLGSSGSLKVTKISQENINKGN